MFATATALQESPRAVASMKLPSSRINTGPRTQVGCAASAWERR
ncbi:hypothetical protein QE392_003432 [Microbacterium proteolyticum]|nr:hypothetical protein [Microbacterium proteolyticum]MDQ1171628.1 hypothetical protein [Microbacterium proteolyticum]